MLSIIVAIAENQAIGKDNDLLWHIPGDLKRFKQITLGHTVIMGKRTYYSLPKRPLAGRKNLVITDIPGELIEGCLMAYSIEDAVSKCNPYEETFIIGGASVYRQFMPLAGRLYLTRVHKSFEADVFFPVINIEEWNVISREDIPKDENLGFSYSYENLERKK
ncbi:MAG: dihydrofolate reductase [Bacteroidetes bacterium]|nr:dihydrofolate reductase [Bacteroidota bacterium]